VHSLGGGSPQQQQAIDTALAVATTNTAIAEAQLAQAFGYELCRCEFPPTPMLTVGHHTRDSGAKHAGDSVYECPKCGRDTASPFLYERTAPPRKPVIRLRRF